MPDGTIDDDCKQLWDLFNGIDRMYNDYAKSVKLSYTELAVLDVIYSHTEGCTQKQICDELFISKQNVNPIVGNLSDRGYVVLKGMPDDRRMKLIELTDEGTAYAESIVKPTWDAFRETLLGMEESDCGEFMRLVSVYADLFTKNMGRIISRNTH